MFPFASRLQLFDYFVCTGKRLGKKLDEVDAQKLLGITIDKTLKCI